MVRRSLTYTYIYNPLLIFSTIGFTNNLGRLLRLKVMKGNETFAEMKQPIRLDKHQYRFNNVILQNKNQRFRSHPSSFDWVLLQKIGAKEQKEIGSVQISIAALLEGSQDEQPIRKFPNLKTSFEGEFELQYTFTVKTTRQ